MTARAWTLVPSTAMLALGSPAYADEQYFGYTYSAEVLGKGATETGAEPTVVVAKLLIGG